MRPPLSSSGASTAPTRRLDARRPVRSLANLAARPQVAFFASGLVVILSILFLLRRMAIDVPRRPIFVDEVLAGLTAVHPLDELLDIVIFDRGGAPLHFVLAHFALALDPSPEALRWLSVVFALAAIPIGYDLGRRLAGRTAGVMTAVIIATSSMLEVWGTIGRMYALVTFAAVLAADLFVRAVALRTTSAAVLAGLAALLLAASHPYGLVVVGCEILVALALWRGRPLRPALPVLALGLLLVPFVVAALRLSDRFGVGPAADVSIAPPEVAARQFVRALAGFAGGDGVAFFVFTGLAVGGTLVLIRRNPAFAALACLALASVPTLLVVVKAGRNLSEIHPHHLIFGLPFWAALIGVGLARGLREVPRLGVPVFVVGLAALAAVSTPAERDPRVRVEASPAVLAGPAAWVRAEVRKDDVLFFHSPVFLAALGTTREATSVPRTGRPRNILERADYPAPSVVVALPLAGSRIDGEKLRATLGERTRVAVFPHWLLVKHEGPFADTRAVVTAAADTFAAVHRTALTRSPVLREQLRSIRTLCRVLGQVGGRCPPAYLKIAPRR